MTCEKCGAELEGTIICSKCGIPEGVPESIPEVVTRTNQAPCPAPGCGVTGCEKHLIACLAPTIVQRLSDQMRLKLVDMTKLLGEIELTEDFKKGMEEAHGLSISSGQTTTYEKIEMSQEEKDALNKALAELPDLEDEEGLLEKAEETANWNLPETPMTAGAGGSRPMKGVTFGGMKVKYSDYNTPPPATQKPMSYYDWAIYQGQEAVVTDEGHSTVYNVYRFKEDHDKLEAPWIEARKIIPRLERKLKFALEAAMRADKEKNKTRGKVDPQAVTKLVTDQTNKVFYKKGDGRDVGTAVSVMLDSSGSMGEMYSRGHSLIGRAGSAGSRDYVRQKVGLSCIMALALGEVCENLGVSFEIVTYQTGGICPGMYAGIYKSFGDEWKKAQDCLGNYQATAGDCPYAGLGWSLSRLSTRPEKRKIQFFLSDANECNDGIDKCYDLAKYAKRRANIDVVGIGIFTEYMKHFMKEKSETVMNPGDLTDTLFARLAKIINPVKA
jgi:cobalamin biosynthesis protein CobT